MTATQTLSIGRVARQTGCTVPTIRYYEEIGLLPPALRTDGGQRHYGAPAVRRLAFIRRCRHFGFSLDEVRQLVELVEAPQRPCVEMRDIAKRHLAEVHNKLSDLRALAADLTRFIRSCDSACAGGAVVDCSLLDDLGTSGDAAPAASRGCCSP